MGKYDKSIQLLNKAVQEELAAVHQYMYFHFVCDDRGYDLLASLFKRTAIEEMMHIEALAERILFLKGEVVMSSSIKVQTIHDVEKMIELAMKMEEASVNQYNEGAKLCSEASDSQSKKVFEALVEKEETHYDQFDVERENMVKFGDNYLALQSIERSKTVAMSAPTKIEE